MASERKAKTVAPMSMVEKMVYVLKSRGYTQDSYEKRMGLATGRFSKWLDGKGVPTAVQAWDIAQDLCVDVIYFLDPNAGEPGMNEADEFDLAYRMVRRLGRKEAERRLMLDDRPGGD